VPPAVVEPLIEKVMNAPEGNLFHISEVFDYPYTERRHSFDSFVCEECGELVAEPFGRIKKGRQVCIPCAGKNA